MTWFRKYRLLLLFLMLLALLGGGSAYYYYNQPRYNASLNKKEGYFVASDLKSYAGIGETGILLAGSELIRANKDYVTASQAGFQKQYDLVDKPSDLNKKDYSLVDVYATSDKKQRKIKTIDVLEVLRAYNSAYITTYGGMLDTMLSDGRSLIQVSVKDTSHSIEGYRDRYKTVSLFIDVKTEKVLTEEEVTEAYSYAVPSYLPLAFTSQVTNLDIKLKERQISLNMSDGGARGIKFNQKSKVSDLRLVKEYPDSRKVIKDGGILYTYKSEDDAQAKEIARLLGTEEETDVFQGVTLYGKYSKDGKDHVVQSYDDLMTWYQEPAEEVGATNP